MDQRSFLRKLFGLLSVRFPDAYLRRLRNEIYPGRQPGQPSFADAPLLSVDLAEKYGQYLHRKTPEEIADCTEYDYIKEHLPLPASCSGRSVPGDAPLLSARMCSAKTLAGSLADVPHIFRAGFALYPVTDAGFGIFKPLCRCEMMEPVPSDEELVSRALDSAAETEPALLFCVRPDSTSDGLLVSPEDLTAGCGKPPADDGLYLLTNSGLDGGAVCIFYPQMMRRLYRRFSSYYLVFAGVHEVIAVPKNSRLGLPELSEILWQANRRRWSENEILTDRIYQYDVEKGLTVC